MANIDRFGRSLDRKITYKPISHSRAVRYADRARTLDQEGFDSGDEMIGNSKTLIMSRSDNSGSWGGKENTSGTSVVPRHRVAFDLRQAGVFVCTKNGDSLNLELQSRREIIFRTHGGSFAFMAGPYRSYSPFGRKLRGGFLFVCLASQVPGTYMTRFHGGQTGDMTAVQMNNVVRTQQTIDLYGDAGDSVPTGKLEQHDDDDGPFIDD